MIDEGYIKFELAWTECEPLDNPEINELSEWRQPLHAAGLIGHYEDLNIGYGNISCRLDTSSFLISGTQTGYLTQLDARHFALVTGFDVDANRVCCRGPLQASSESLTHAAIYTLDRAIGAVVHVHSDELWAEFNHQLPTTGETVAYGTPEMAREFTRLYRDTNFRDDGIAVMGGHEAGLISIGVSVAEAARRILALSA
jgi:ribulose-5-phosphate 4-epimerase/fuculose-1-phosphate aldolase